MSILLFSLSLLIALAQEHVVNTLRANTARVKRWSGYILLGVGLWLLALALWADFFAQLFPV